MNITQRFASGLLATGLLTAGLFTAAAVTSPTEAHARCNGGSGIVSDYWTGGVRRAVEDPISGTCNGNSTYQAELIDPVTDGACASVQFMDGGNPWLTDTTSCTTGARVPFSYRDVNGNSNAWERFCVEEYGCGWGRNGETRGLNNGF